MLSSAGAALLRTAARRGGVACQQLDASRRAGSGMLAGTGRGSGGVSVWGCRARAMSASTASMADGTGEKNLDDGEVVRHIHMPQRTVPDELLTITMRTYKGADTADRYPNVHGIHPAEFKVELRVHVPDLGLTEKQEERLLLLVGPRYHAKRKVLKLVCDTYPNRIDNKRYLVYLLETLLVEARRAEE